MGREQKPMKTIIIEEGAEKDMRDEYDIKALNPRKNPYAKALKKQVTINLNNETIDYFKELANETAIPYQTLINMYLTDCAAKKRKLKLSWE